MLCHKVSVEGLRLFPLIAKPNSQAARTFIQSQYLKAFAASLRVGFCDEWKRDFNRNSFQQMGNLVAANMQEHGTKFIERSVPTAIEKLQDGRLRVEWKNLESDETHEDLFDTVMFAIGRKPPLLFVSPWLRSRVPL